MNKKTKDYIFIGILILFYVAILLVKTNFGEYSLGTVGDFKLQYLPMAEYFRNLFYKNFDLFPDFAFNLGAGMNIYYLAYYGFLSPMVLLSYLFPMIKMIDFMILTSAIIVISSSILFYYFLRKEHDELTSFLGSFLFLSAVPIIYNSTQEILFINYFPFLILALFGVDKYIEKNKSLLLMISIALIIFSSYYFAFSAIVVIIIYAIYKFIKLEKQGLLKFILKLALRIIVSCLISGILIIPTIHVLLLRKGK